MRGMVEGLETPHPMGALLPSLYHDDDFTQALTAGLDQVLAPVFSTLDALEAYIDPGTAPSDFLDWLASWVGLELDASWPEEGRRALVAKAIELYTWQGTIKGLVMLIETYTGITPEIVDSGGATWSPTPDGDLPGDDSATIKMKLTVPGDVAIDTSRLERLVAGAKPAHMLLQLEVSNS
ncbi:MAG: phage tail protein I [Acidimicrobiales bacterium]